MQIDPKQLELMKQYLGDFREDLAEALSKQIESSQRTTKYLDVLCHQFRTPLAGVRLAIELLRGSEAYDQWDSASQNTMDSIYEAIRSLNSLLNDIVLAQEIEKSTLALSRDEVLLGDFMEEVLKEIHGVKESATSPLNVSVHGEMERVNVDKYKLKHVMVNLIKNALQYSPEGSPIFVEVEVKEGRLIFSVQDQGIGIPEQEQKDIFERFFRGSNAMTYTTDQSGLGLYIAQHFVRQHGGEIHFESEENKGSRFTFEIPL